MTDFADYIDALSPEKRELLEVLLAEQAEQVTGDVFPLSYAQQRLWFLSMFEPASALYNLPAVVRLTGQLDLGALETSLNTIIQRHEILRTSYRVVNGQPMQVLHSQRPLSIHQHDLTQVAPAEREHAARQIAFEEIQAPFDLKQSHVVRALIIQLQPQEHWLVLTIHHIAADGWSIGVLLRELTQAYHAACGGYSPRLPELAIQYADFTLWQQEYLAGEVLAEQLAYWRSALADAPNQLALPLDYPRPAVQSFNGARFNWTIDPDLTQGLHDLSRQHGVTLFMTLLASFNTLLYRYTNQTDLLVGTPIANRNQAEIEELIGFFVNTLVLRSQINPEQSFSSLLQQVSATTLAAYEHQDLPFEMLVKELNIERNLSHSALFQVMLVLQNTPMPSVDLGQLSLSPIELDRGLAKFDLTLTLEETANGLAATFEYNRDLFTTTTIEQMAQHFNNLLQAIRANPQQTIAELPLLSTAEFDYLIGDLNQTAVDFGEVRPIQQRFEAHALAQPHTPAVVFENQALTYQELDHQANQLAWYLQQQGVGANTPVAICLERSLELAIAILGILKAGGAYLPIDPKLPSERINLMLQEAQCQLVITDRAVAGMWEQATSLALDLPAIKQAPTQALPQTNHPDDLAYIIFTSGSTGTPKGVAVAHRQLDNYVQAIQARFNFAAQANFATVSTIAADLGNTMIFGAWASGGCLHIISDERIRDAHGLADYFRQQQIDYLKLVPSHLAALLKAYEHGDLLPRRGLILGGESAAWSLIHKIHELAPDCQIFNHYGPTETTIGVITHDLRAALAEPFGDYAPLGRPIANTQIYLLDQALQPVPQGVAGELYIGGANVSQGYLHRSELTNQRFIANPWSPASKLYRTGDLARINHDGTIQYVGRIDQQVKIRGFRVELAEIEAVLRQYPAVRESVVVAYEQQLVAYSVPNESMGIDQADVRQFLQQRLPEYMVPVTYIELANLPLTANGKLDRRALPQPVVAASELADTAIARSPLETIVADVFSAVLDRQQVGIHQNFFELGGHSLLAIQVIARLSDLTMLNVPIRSLFEFPTAAGLARYIAQQQASNQPMRLLPADRNQDLALSFAQERVWFLHQLDPQSSVYHLTYNLRLEGKLDLAALEHSFAMLVQRHEILRTTFGLSANQPIQIIHDRLPLNFKLVDLRHYPISEQDQAAQAAIQTLAETPFDLINGPLLRISVVRLSDTEQLLLVALHHIVADAWSIDILRRELSQLYRAAQQQQPAALAALAVQYADFAQWQRQWLQAEVLEQQLGYWQQQLAHLPTLDLPTDYPRPFVQNFRGALYHFNLAEQLVGELKGLSRHEGSTLFMTLLAAFQTLLYRYSGQADFAVGTPIANRHHAQLEQVFGFFLNMLVIRGDLAGNPSFREVLKRVRETALQAYAHQDLPFEKVVDALQPERDLSRSPLFQVMFVLQHDNQFNWDLPDVQVTALPADYTTAKFDLTLTMVETQTGLRASFEYNQDLFSHATIAQMAQHMQNLLAAIVANPDQAINQLGLLSDAEQQYVLHELNATQTEYVQQTTIHELFEAQVRQQPQATALVYQQHSLSYAELNQQANALAAQILGLGLTQRSIIGIYMERSLEMVIAMLAILKTGAAYLPLDPNYPAERVDFMLADAQTALVLTQSHLHQRLASTQMSIVVDSNTHAHAAPNPEQHVLASDLAYVIYTSGSTGKPKGVMVGHDNAINFFVGMDQRLGTEQQGTWLAVTSMAFDISVLELLWTLTRGFKVVLQPDLARNPTASAEPSTNSQALDFSLFYFASDTGQDPQDKYRLLLEGAKFADQHGFTAVWTPERHFHSFGGLYPNPSVVGAAIAAVTERIQIRAGSVVLPLQHPLRVAEEWSVVDNISKGRVGVSFASGWHADDFVLAPANYHERKDIMFRDINTVRSLWRGDAQTFVGGNGNDVAVRIYPQPIQAELPFWVTAGGSPETFRMAGEAGANMLTHLLGQSVEDLQAKIAIYRQAWQEHGHPGRGCVTLMVHTFVSDQPLESIRETVRQPFYRYLRSSIDLWKNLARSLGHDRETNDFSAEEEEFILAQAFDRYFATSSLFGTPEHCLAMVNRLKAVGVDEVGCLIDFGVATDDVLANLQHLSVLRERSNPTHATLPSAEPIGDYSVLAQIQTHAVSHLQCTPALARMLLSEPEAAQILGTLDHVLLGGEALPLNLADQLKLLINGQLHNMYGPTETTIWSSSYEVSGQETEQISIGRPIANTAIYILDRYQQPVPLGIAGELYIAGHGVVRGYLERPELTAERFVPNPFSPELSSRMYRTGDRARYRRDGTLEFLGRIDYQVKLQGYRIELGEIEAVLEQHPLVEQAIVVARDEAENQRLAAYIVPTHKILAPLQPALNEAQANQLFEQHRRYTLPNGMNIAYLSDLQANAGYREVIEEAMYLKHGIELHDGDCVFDVGANIGFFELFANMYAKQLKLYAFEPIPPTFAVLEANIRYYGLESRIFPFGLSDKAETTEFTFYPEMAGLSGRYSETGLDRQITKSIILSDLRQVDAQGTSVVLEETELDAILDTQLASETYQCQLRTLSEVIAEQQIERIDLLKIDVEKAEVDVLMGIKQADWLKIQQIVLEIDNRENLEQIITMLKQQHFAIVVEDFAVAEAQAGEPGVYVYMLYARRVAADSPLLAQPVSILPAPPQRSLTSGDLRTWVKNRLPEYMLPASFSLLNSLPLTPNGKVDRKALPAPSSTRPSVQASYIAPESPTEQAIAAIWQQVLQVEQVGLHDNFFELGGSSLLIVQARTKLREVLAIDISLVDLFRYPTVASLAEKLGSNATNTAANFDKVRERAERQRQAKQQRSKGRK
ncbi:amino acid adenylation domain-containing protein [Herpetosiphon sp. NSE202]|uniref:amino acid adenylation domain-containing protein n=1 Tax=Herpetosiphon sp. NSE202 TaxID=3351349 RepID=UPI003629A853